MSGRAGVDWRKVAGIALATCATLASAAGWDNPDRVGTIGEWVTGWTRIASYIENKVLTGYAINAKVGLQTIQFVGSTSVAAREGDARGIAVTLGDRAVTLVAESLFTDVAAVASTPTRIAVSNDADTFDVACDGVTMVVAGANSATPVALVDVRQGRELATLSFAGKLARSVAVDGLGTQALVVLDAGGISTGGSIRRVGIANGTLSNSGPELSFAGEYVSRVSMAPGGQAGVAVVGGGTTRLVAFTVPTLTVTGSVSLAGVGNAAVFSADGTRVFVRSGNRGDRDSIVALAFDPKTGALGVAPLWRSDAVSGFTGTVFHSPLAISPDGLALIAGDENTDERLSTPRLTVLDPATGAFVRGIDLSAGARPRTVFTHRSCAAGAPRQAVEYYHAGFDHYFVTTLANEIALLDNGTLAGWARTGQQFNVFAAGTADAADTCRFFSESFAPKSSHFYTPSAAECTTVKANPSWQFEGVVFGLAPTTPDGACASGMAPLYRLYNDGQGAAPNHRYTTQPDIRAQMMSRGWIPEGAGIGIIGCVPP